jgi:hypothetical protein
MLSFQSTNVRGMNDSGDSILEVGDILEADIWRVWETTDFLEKITGLLPR